MITIQGTEINFGDIQFGKSYNKDFEIINNNDTPLKITGLGKSCTCTDVWIDSDTIPAKKTGIIHVKITPGSKGVFLRSFWFTAGATHTIKLKGNVT